MPVAWGGSIVIGCPPEHLWNILVDAAADTDWRAPWVRSVRSLTPGPTRPGSRYASRYDFFWLLNETATRGGGLTAVTTSSNLELVFLEVRGENRGSSSWPVTAGPGAV